MTFEDATDLLSVFEARWRFAGLDSDVAATARFGAIEPESVFVDLSLFICLVRCGIDDWTEWSSMRAVLFLPILAERESIPEE